MTQETKDLYLSILRRFQSDDWRQGDITEPFNAGDKSMATNGGVLVAVPIIGDYPDKSEKMAKIYPLPSNMDGIIRQSDLIEKMNSFPVVNSYDDIKCDCGACGGHGVVDFEFYYGRNYYIEEECPVCEGAGNETKKSEKPNGEKEPDESKFIEIGNSIFRYDTIEYLLFVSKKLNGDIRLVNQTNPNRATLFRINEADVLLMPCYRNGETEVEITIPIYK